MKPGSVQRYVLFFLVLCQATTAVGQVDSVPGNVVDVRPNRGQATLRFPPESGLETTSSGFIQSDRGPVNFRVVQVLSESEVLVREERRSEFERIRVGDRARLFPSRDRVTQEAEESFRKIDALLEIESTAEESLLEQAPDLLADVTEDVLLDYEAWLLLLESEELPEGEVPVLELKETVDLPSYPDLEVRQTFRSGVDYDQFVFHATEETHAPRITNRQIGRYARWNYVKEGDLDPVRDAYFENELEVNQDYLYEEMNFSVDRNFSNGDRFYWDNRSIWKVFNNDQGDSFVQNNLEVRSTRKLDDRWEWQRGIDVDFRHEYATDRDDGYLGLTFVSEWNYRNGFEEWVDIAYELTREFRLDPDNRTQEYWEHRLLTHVFKIEGDVSFDLDGDFHYRDYNQPGSNEDEFISIWTATCRRRIDDSLSKGWRLTLEPRFFPTTEDLNSNAVRTELARIYEFSRGAEFFLTFEPRFGQVFHFGSVPDDIALDPRLPRDKSDGDYREAGVNLSISWFPNERWRVNFFEDINHRWFPEGETGVTAFYLFDFPRIADYTGTYTSLSIDYLPREDFEVSLTASHSKQFYDTFDENESSSFNVGIEAIYRF